MEDMCGWSISPQEIAPIFGTLFLTLLSGQTKPLIINQVLFSVSAHPLILHGVYPE